MISLFDHFRICEDGLIAVADSEFFEGDFTIGSAFVSSRDLACNDVYLGTPQQTR